MFAISKPGIQPVKVSIVIIIPSRNRGWPSLICCLALILVQMAFASLSVVRESLVSRAGGPDVLTELKLSRAVFPDAPPLQQNLKAAITDFDKTAQTAMFSIPPGTLQDAADSDGSVARVRLVIPSLAAVESKVKWLIELSPDTQLRKQWKKLKRDFIDAFTDGVDETKPVSVDVVFPSNGMAYDLCIPIADLTSPQTGFLDGLRGRNYKVKKVKEAEYELRPEKGAAAHLSFDKTYAWIVTGNRATTKPHLSLTTDVAPLAEQKKDIVIELKNEGAGLVQRRENYERFRQQFIGRAKIRKTEGQNAFQLRKLMLNSLLAQAESLVVEAEHAHLDWTIQTSSPIHFGRGELSIVALPETELMQAIQNSAVRPSHFASVNRPVNSVITSKLNVPLGPGRIRQFKDFLTSLQPIVEKEIEARPELKVTQQKALVRATGIAIEMIGKSIESGKVDAFFDLFFSATNKPVLVSGIRATDGKQADQIAKLLSVIHPDWRVKLDVRVHAGVSLHKVEIGPADLSLFQSVFAGETEFYLGTSRDAVWCAAGDNCLTSLITAIDRTAKSAPDQVEPVLFDYHINLGRLVSILDSVQKQFSSRDKALTQGQRETRRDIEKYLKVAKDSMSSCEATMDGDLRLTHNHLEGSAQFNECSLRCLGSIVAATVKDLE